jgi:hypothetical protein
MDPTPQPALNHAADLDSRALFDYVGPMPRDGSITPSDLVGKLDWLVVVCDKCGRKGRYSVARLVRLGPDTPS